MIDYIVEHYEDISHILKTESVFKGFLNNEEQNTLIVTIVIAFMGDKESGCLFNLWPTLILDFFILSFL